MSAGDNAFTPSVTTVQPEMGFEEVTVLRGSANDITVEASLGKMYDEGRKAGIAEGTRLTRETYEIRLVAARAAGFAEGEKHERAARKARKAAKRARLLMDERDDDEYEGDYPT